MHGAAAVDFTGWEKVEIDDSLVNSSLTTVYSVMVPPGTQYTTNDTESGPMTILTNETDKNLVYAIYVIDNPLGEKFTNETAKLFIDNFMIGANITPLEGLDPVVISDGLVLYGTQGENAAGVYILSNNEKVTILTGMYRTMDDANTGIENLAMIAGTIDITPTEKK
ncbi:MAG: hypothetical protein CVV33_03565 [Methanomicrobiales archaeon HGW-Methanomicrobiales-4]|nr:MAG: hypothetical protein CVV33_03565 [Methanomicrobiales archaeon HGW-Methanomicrobiales-4]